MFLNDDTIAVDPQWLKELAGWASRPEIGLVGLQLIDPAGLIQHGGVIVGLGGYADHLFQAMRPGEDSLLGSTRWYRNVLSVTGACLAVRRDVFEKVGGFDERFELCGSDVVLGLDTTFLGLRNVCSPFAEVRHLESATRGTDVPDSDFFASYWRYHKWLVGGDPYWSPNLSMYSSRPSHEARCGARSAWPRSPLGSGGPSPSSVSATTKPRRLGWPRSARPTPPARGGRSTSRRSGWAPRRPLGQLDPA